MKRNKSASPIGDGSSSPAISSRTRPQSFVLSSVSPSGKPSTSRSSGFHLSASFSSSAFTADGQNLPPRDSAAAAAWLRASIVNPGPAACRNPRPRVSGLLPFTRHITFDIIYVHPSWHAFASPNAPPRGLSARLLLPPPSPSLGSAAVSIMSAPASYSYARSAHPHSLFGCMDSYFAASLPP